MFRASRRTLEHLHKGLDFLVLKIVRKLVLVHWEVDDDQSYKFLMHVVVDGTVTDGTC